MVRLGGRGAQGRVAGDRRAEPRARDRFEHMGEERLARWLSGTDWRDPAALQQLFESAEPAVEAAPLDRFEERSVVDQGR